MQLDPKTVHVPEISGVWLNSPPLTLRQLRGRVVLVDFWDFTCVNCIRTLPYVREWHQRYEPVGLSVIGIHTPEFDFGRTTSVLEQGIAEFELPYPVMLDNDFSAWQGFANKYWPSKYLVDGDGYVRYRHAGEGSYGETELAIQELLRERDAELAMPEPMALLRPLDAPGAYAVCRPATAELYLGYRRGLIANATGVLEDQEWDYRAGAGASETRPALDGLWRVSREALVAAGRARVSVLYDGAEVNLVAAPGGDGEMAELVIRQHGAPLRAEIWGDDVVRRSDGETVVRVIRPRLISLIRSGVFEQACLEVSCEVPGVQLYAFTFGSCMEAAIEEV